VISPTVYRFVYDAQFDLKDCHFSRDSRYRHFEPKFVGIFAFSPFLMSMSLKVMAFCILSALKTLNSTFWTFFTFSPQFQLTWRIFSQKIIWIWKTILLSTFWKKDLLKRLRFDWDTDKSVRDHQISFSIGFVCFCHILDQFWLLEKDFLTNKRSSRAL